jgi:hypothetical protein
LRNPTRITITLLAGKKKKKKEKRRKKTTTDRFDTHPKRFTYFYPHLSFLSIFHPKNPRPLQQLTILTFSHVGPAQPSIPQALIIRS